MAYQSSFEQYERSITRISGLEMFRVGQAGTSEKLRFPIKYRL